ncbi:hypothetical protein LLO_p0038 (plasmid) [Legionella longbeachae NSW150]|uniref:Trypsin-like peptidase domain-containing protein n=1 Tax=Legionella longbeachae serogroup 1 (strain NSW150) TaxID=661367 RepID=D3HTU7_LEGLN|nr:hypothetical protein [Legionella longbeachae]CBJ13955.1 hypothetical protein LLO_p0038 [Legionella longbeachae NSW150]
MIVIQPKTVSEQLLYTTVRIVGETGTGTGFFFKYKLNNSTEIQFILTNKHVVDGNKSLRLKFHEAQTKLDIREVSNQSFELGVNIDHNMWFPHPKPDIDLGAILFAPIQQHAQNIMNKDIYGIFLDDSLIKDDVTLQLESDVSDDILMIGYPIGLWDDINNFPIVRKGITAILL